MLGVIFALSVWSLWVMALGLCKKWPNNLVPLIPPTLSTLYPWYLPQVLIRCSRCARVLAQTVYLMELFWFCDHDQVLAVFLSPSVPVLVSFFYVPPLQPPPTTPKFQLFTLKSVAYDVRKPPFLCMKAWLLTTLLKKKKNPCKVVVYLAENGGLLWEGYLGPNMVQGVTMPINNTGSYQWSRSLSFTLDASINFDYLYYGSLELSLRDNSVGGHVSFFFQE